MNENIPPIPSKTQPPPPPPDKPPPEPGKASRAGKVKGTKLRVDVGGKTLPKVLGALAPLIALKESPNVQLQEFLDDPATLTLLAKFVATRVREYPSWLINRLAPKPPKVTKPKPVVEAKSGNDETKEAL